MDGSKDREEELDCRSFEADQDLDAAGGCGSHL
jgi:hypothetical protein